LGPQVITNSADKLGWTIGAGLETMIWRHWLARAEYRYADFGTSSFAIARTGGPVGGVQSWTDTYDLVLRTHTATFGLAYKFN
jgi:outer membrane immunogenic protein